MKIRIITVSHRQPDWVRDGYQEYARRIASGMSVELVEITPGDRGKNRTTQQVMAQEAERILAAIPAGYQCIALEVKGKHLSTEAWASAMKKYQDEAVNIAIIIGGADGLAASLSQSAQQSWSLSALTLPHGLVRLVLIEQLYRVWSLLQGHPYHRG